MKERIEELAHQAYDHDTMIGFHYIPEEFKEKFAKLIVAECIRVPYAMWDKAELNADVAVKIEHRIKEHFGMEQ